ncbi:hypothetical protein [Sphingomonas sp.]|jgi:hypothetical protein|nr:hypothetical protein [Sphingomonas sp.]
MLSLAPDYLVIVRRVTGIVLLWQRRGELRLWGPDRLGPALFDGTAQG